MTGIREQAHEHIERMTGDEVLGVKEFLATYPDRMGAVLRNAPWDDEPWTEEDERAWAEAENGLSRTAAGASLMKRSSDGTVSGDLHSPLQVEWTKQADADLAKLAKRDRRRVRAAVQQFADTRHGHIKRLGGFAPPRFRLRVGDWRVFFRREPRCIHVHRVLHRREAYRKSSWIGHEIPWRKACVSCELVRDCRVPRIANRCASRVRRKRSRHRRVPLGCSEFLALSGCLNRRRLIPAQRLRSGSMS